MRSVCTYALGLSDEDVPAKNTNDPQPVKEAGDSSPVAELQLELQQCNEMITLKSEEIRRLSLQNQDYENQVRECAGLHV